MNWDDIHEVNDRENLVFIQISSSIYLAIVFDGVRAFSGLDADFDQNTRFSEHNENDKINLIFIAC